MALMAELFNRSIALSDGTVIDEVGPQTDQTTPEKGRETLGNTNPGMVDPWDALEATNEQGLDTLFPSGGSYAVVVLDPDLGPVLNIVDEDGNVGGTTQEGVDAIDAPADGPTATTNEVASPPPIFGDEDFDQ